MKKGTTVIKLKNFQTGEEESRCPDEVKFELNKLFKTKIAVSMTNEIKRSVGNQPESGL
jgi:hypothetical protein